MNAKPMHNTARVSMEALTSDCGTLSLARTNAGKPAFAPGTRRETGFSPNRCKLDTSGAGAWARQCVTIGSQKERVRMITTVLRRRRTIPPMLPAGRLPRPRLRDLLDRSARLPVTVVHAPPGYGKSTAVAEWAATSASPVAWFSLDAGSDGLAPFVLGMIQAMREVDAGIGHELEFAIMQRVELAPEEMGNLLISSLASLDAPVIQVIDDVHLLNDPDVLAMLQTVLRFADDRIHLVLIAQHELASLLANARLRGQVTEVTVTDLTFAPAEAREFLQLWMGDRLTAAELEQVARQADGWVAGLKLGAIAVAGGGNLPSLSRPLDAYADGVMAGWTPQLRSLMGVVALLGRVSPALLQATAPEWLENQPAETFLAEAEQHGLLLAPVDAGQTWYQLHGALRDALQRRLPRLLAETNRLAVHQRAAAWYLEHQDVSAAIGHALAGGEEDLAIGIVRQEVDRALAFDRWPEIDQWLSVIPFARLNEETDLLLAKAWIHQARGQNDAALAFLARVQQVLGQHPVPGDADDVRRRIAEVELLRVLVSPTPIPAVEAFAIYAASFAALRDIDCFASLVAMQYHLVALSRTDQDAFDAAVTDLLRHHAGKAEPFGQLRVLFIRVVQVLAHGRTGHALRLLDLSQGVLLRAQALGIARQEAFGHFLVGSLHYELNHLAQAEQHFRAVLTNSRAGIRVRVGSEARLARVLDAQGRQNEARELLRNGVERLLEIDTAEYVWILRSAELALAVKEWEILAMRRLAGLLDIQAPRDRATEVENPEVLLPLVDLDQDDGLVQADVRLQQLEQDAANLHWLSPRLVVRTLRALWHERRGDRAAANQVLASVLHEAEAAGYFRTLADLGPSVRDLLARYRDDHASGPYLDALLAVADPRALEPAPVTVSADRASVALARAVMSALTHREMDILLGLQARMSNKEIAATLSISPLTVKSHTQNIYAKLGVRNRRQAIAKAVELEILPAWQPAFGPS